MEQTLQRQGGFISAWRSSHAFGILNLIFNQTSLMNHMKSTAVLLHAALAALLVLPAYGTMDEFLKNSPLGKDRLEAERVLRQDAGSLNNAHSTSGMEVAGNGKLGGVDFIRRVHFSKGKVSGYEWYAEGDPIALDGVWSSVGNALSKAYGASPVVMVPQERLGELSPIGDTRGKLKCWSNRNHALCAFLEISGRKAYLVFGQYDLQAEGIPLLDDTGTSDYMRGLLGKQSGKLRELWKPGEAGVLSPVIDGRAADAGLKEMQPKPGGTRESIPEISNASDSEDNPNRGFGGFTGWWGLATIVIIALLVYVFLRKVPTGGTPE